MPAAGGATDTLLTVFETQGEKQLFAAYQQLEKELGKLHQANQDLAKSQAASAEALTVSAKQSGEYAQNLRVINTAAGQAGNALGAMTSRLSVHGTTLSHVNGIQEKAIATHQAALSEVTKFLGVTDRLTAGQRAQATILSTQTHNFEQLQGNISRMSGGMQRAAKTLMTGNVELDLLSMRLDRASMMMWKFTISAIPLRQMMMYAAGTTAALVGLSVASINVAADLDRAERAFYAATGSMAEAADTVQYLRDQAPKIRYSLQQVIEAGRILTVAGYDAKALLYPMADLAAGVGQAGVTIEHASRAFVDAMHGEMRRLRNTFDITREEVEAIAGDAVTATGQIVDKQRWMAAVTQAIMQKYGGANKAAMSGITGLWETFRDEITRAAAAMGELLLPDAITLLKVMSGMLGVVQSLLQMPIVGWMIKSAVVVAGLAAGLTAGAAAAGMLYIELLGIRAAFQTFQQTGTGEQKKMLEAEHQLLMAQQQLAILEAQRAQVLMPLITAQMAEQVALEERLMALRAVATTEERGGDTSAARARLEAADAEVEAARAATDRLDAAQREVQVRTRIIDLEKKIAQYDHATAERRTREQAQTLKLLNEHLDDLSHQADEWARRAGDERGRHFDDRKLDIPELDNIRAIMDEMSPAADKAVDALDGLQQAESAVARQRQRIATLEQRIEAQKNAVGAARVKHDQQMTAASQRALTDQELALDGWRDQLNEAQTTLKDLEGQHRVLRRERGRGVSALRYLQEGHRRAWAGMRDSWNRLKSNLGAVSNVVKSVTTRFSGLIVGMLEMAIVAAAIGAAVTIVRNHAERFQRALEQASESLDLVISRLERMRDIGYEIDAPVESMAERRRRIDEAAEQVKGGTWWERYALPTTVTFDERMDERDVDPRTRDELEQRLLQQMERETRERHGDKVWEQWRERHPDGLGDLPISVEAIERALADMQKETKGVAEAARDLAATKGRVAPPGFEGISGGQAFEEAKKTYSEVSGTDPRVLEAQLRAVGDAVEDQTVALGEMYATLADERERDAETIQSQIDAMEKEGATTEELLAAKKQQSRLLKEAADLQKMATRLTFRDADAQKANKLARAANEAAIEAQTYALEQHIAMLDEEISLLQAAGVETAFLTDKNAELTKSMFDLADAYDELGEKQKAHQTRQKAQQQETENETKHLQLLRGQFDSQAASLESLGREEEADRTRLKALGLQEEELARKRERNAANLQKMRESGKYTQDDLQRLENYMAEEERALELELQAAQQEARLKPLERGADLAAAQARRMGVTAEHAENTYRAQRRSLGLQLQLARERSDEVGEEEAKTAIWELDKQHQLGAAQRAVEAAELNAEMAKLRGNYREADKWERIRLQRLEDLQRVQMAWGMTADANESQANILRGGLQLLEEQYTRLKDAEEADLRTMEERGVAIDARVRQIQKLILVEEARARQLVAQGRSPEDPAVQGHIANAMKYRRQQWQITMGYAQKEYEVLKAMADLDMATADQAEAARQRALQYAKQLVMVERMGSQERLDAWQAYLRLMEDGESQIDKTVARIIGAPQELLNYISSADMAARFGDVAASLGVGHRPDVSILGKYDNRTLIEIRYGGGSPPSLESAIDAGVDGFVRDFTRILEKGG